MVSKQVSEGVALWDDVFSHRDAGCACEVIFAHSFSAAGVGHFIVRADEVRLYFLKKLICYEISNYK